MSLLIRYAAVNLLFVLIFFPGIVFSDSSEVLEKPSLESSKQPNENEEDVSSEPASSRILPVKIGVVDIQRVIAESKKGREAKRYYEGLASLRTEEELARTEQELVGQILQDIDIIVEEYAREQGFSLMIDTLEGGIIYVDESVDITDKVIEFYDNKVDVSTDQN